jgi:hypothetical protein
MCRLFRRSGRFDKSSPRVLHSHNNFAGFGAAERQLEPEKAAAGDMPENAFLRINFPVKIRLRSPRDSPHELGPARTKKAAAMDAAASRNVVSGSSDLVLIAAV